MSNEAVAKELKMLSYDLWECQDKVSKINKLIDKSNITTLRLIHEYKDGEHNAYIQSTVTKILDTGKPEITTTQLDPVEHLKYDPETINEIVSEIIRATNERIDFVAMGDASLSNDDIREIFINYFSSAMVGMEVECCHATASVSAGAIDKVIVTVS